MKQIIIICFLLFFFCSCATAGNIKKEVGKDVKEEIAVPLEGKALEEALKKARIEANSIRGLKIEILNLRWRILDWEAKYWIQVGRTIQREYEGKCYLDPRYRIAIEKVDEKLAEKKKINKEIQRKLLGVK